MTRASFGRASVGIAALCSAASGVAFAEDCRVPLDRSLTLRSWFPHSVEAEHGRMAAGESRLSFTLPRPIGRPCDDAGPDPLLAFRSPDSLGGVFSVQVVAGEEYRDASASVFATEAGGIFYGEKGPLSAHLDARMFSESGGDPLRPSYDHESIDDQNKAVTGSIDYRSYARFRGDLNLDLPIGRLTAARDAAHWGPGLYGNGVLSQEAVPFYQYVYATRIGPLSVTSLYGDLQIGANQNAASGSSENRNLFAHRYELALGERVLLGVSEELILYDFDKPFLFVPIFPLFIAKSLMSEDNSNGNIAIDASWRSPWNGLLYGEFLLDDLESPSSLFLRDYVQNKWAALVGMHWVRNIHGALTGLIVEANSVEPWVYSHFKSGTAQAANLGLPLGNPFGPDSRTLIVKPYARVRGGWYFALTGGLFWKGHGPGADLNAPTPPDPTAKKDRLAGETSPDFAIEPEVDFAWKRLSTGIDARFGQDSRVVAAIRIFL